jgi:hypothetical protein
MKKLAMGRAACGIAVLIAAAGSGSATQAGDLPAWVHFSGLLNDYTPSAAVVKGGPYEMRGRWAHTHHISMKDGVVSDDWVASCPALSPAAVGGFVVTGPVTITGNGSPALFGNPSQLTVCVLGGNDVTYSNVTLTFGAPASNHFGKQAVHGVVLKCTGPWGHELSECTLQE